MISTSLVPASSTPLAGRNDTTGGLQSALSRQLAGSQLQHASTTLILAASVTCDLSAVTSYNAVLDAAVTEMACSPPRTQAPVYTYTTYSRGITVPSFAPARAKPRRRRSGAGGDDDFWSNIDDGGSFGGNGGDDDNGWGGKGDGEGSDGSGDSASRWMQDFMLLWTVFCAWSMCSVAQHMTRTKPSPSPAFTAITYSALMNQVSRNGNPMSTVA